MEYSVINDGPDYMDIEVGWSDGNYAYSGTVSLDKDDGRTWRTWSKAIQPMEQFEECEKPNPLPSGVEQAMQAAEAHAKDVWKKRSTDNG